MTSDIKKTSAERIEILRRTENIINTFLHILHNANTKWYWFADSRILSLPLAFQAIMKAILEAKSQGNKIKIYYRDHKREYRTYLRVYGCFRHLEGIKRNFGVSDVEYIAISTTTNALGDSKSSTRACAQSVAM